MIDPNSSISNTVLYILQREYRMNELRICETVRRVKSFPSIPYKQINVSEKVKMDLHYMEEALLNVANF